MKKRIRSVLSCILILAFAVGAAMTVRQMQHKSAGNTIYSQAQQLASAGVNTDTEEEPVQTGPAEQEPMLVWMPEEVEDDPVLEELQQIDLEALRQVNSQVMGWIRIPDTNIDYPVMQGTDNDYYLNHAWDGTENIVGSIYMESRNSPNMTDYNTLIYGHNMRDGSMFAQIRSYCTQEFWEQRPYVYLVTDQGVLRYEIFSSYVAEMESAAYGLSFRHRSTREAFLTAAMESSVIETGVIPGIRDRILTLSTCSGAGYNNRWVIHARLKMVQAEV